MIMGTLRTIDNVDEYENRSWEDFISYGSFREIKEDSGVKGSADNIISGFQKMLYWLHKILSKMAQMISAAKDYARRALSDTVITREGLKCNGIWLKNTARANGLREKKKSVCGRSLKYSDV
ncbi:unnamed protein product [Dracunculus medinensis]|uniref:Transposase n=1 Tax=Dracunculus medinensis TaxID=318479 RepID=A0A0N4U5X3_DRAME|nr:unnamed protein product [Dracunculus medinensis]